MRRSSAVILGDKIRKLRKSKNLTQIDLAVLVNLSPIYINFIENGRRRPSLKSLERVARALKVSSKDLL